MHTSKVNARTHHFFSSCAPAHAVRLRPFLERSSAAPLAAARGCSCPAVRRPSPQQASRAPPPPARYLVRSARLFPRLLVATPARRLLRVQAALRAVPPAARSARAGRLTPGDPAVCWSPPRRLRSRPAPAPPSRLFHPRRRLRVRTRCAFPARAAASPPCRRAPGLTPVLPRMLAPPNSVSAPRAGARVGCRASACSHAGCDGPGRLLLAPWPAPHQPADSCVPAVPRRLLPARACSRPHRLWVVVAPRRPHTRSRGGIVRPKERTNALLGKCLYIEF